MCIALPRLDRSIAPRSLAGAQRSRSNFLKIRPCRPQAVEAERLEPICQYQAPSAHLSYALKGRTQLGVLRVRCILKVGPPDYSPGWKTLAHQALIEHGRRGLSAPLPGRFVRKDRHGKKNIKGQRIRKTTYGKYVRHATPGQKVLPLPRRQRGVTL